MATRLTTSQIYYLRRLAQGVTKQEFWKWDQRQTRGMYMRMIFKFVRPSGGDSTYAMLTTHGWEVFKASTTPKYRKDPTRPIFKISGAQRRKTA